MVARDTAANAEDHGTVTKQKGFKGCFVLLVDEGHEQLPIRPVRLVLPQCGPTKMPNHRVHLSRGHSCPRWPVAFDLCPFVARSEPSLYTLFPRASRAGKLLPESLANGRRRYSGAGGDSCKRSLHPKRSADPPERDWSCREHRAVAANKDCSGAADAITGFATPQLSTQAFKSSPLPSRLLRQEVM